MTARPPARPSAILASLGLALVVAELCLRALRVSFPLLSRVDPIAGWAHIPGAHAWFNGEGHSYVRFNSDGWRDRERSVGKPAGVTRIAVLGDSYMEALQVAQDSALPALLERGLNSTGAGRYEVLNFGVSGYGTAQELLVLRHRALNYAPDAVMLAVTTGNDVSDNSRALKQSDNTPYITLVDDRLVLDTSFLTSRTYRAQGAWWVRIRIFLQQHSRLAQLVYRAKDRLGQLVWQARHPAPTDSMPGERELGLEAGVYRNPPPDRAWAEAWKVTERLVTAISVECRSRHLPFYVVTLSNPVQVTPDTAYRRALAAEMGVADLFEPERRVERLGSREGFDVLALAPLLASQAIATHQYYHGFGAEHSVGHWNERGHRAAATLLTPWLAERLARDLGHR